MRILRLPSGLTLRLSWDAVIDPDDSWFDCPADHFWYWADAPDISSAPGQRKSDLRQLPAPARVPRNRDEVKRFIRVRQMGDSIHAERAEWLAEFPRYVVLDAVDMAAWTAWMTSPDAQSFLDQAIDRCSGLASRKGREARPAGARKPAAP